MSQGRTSGLAIIAGGGDLPRLLAEACVADGTPYCVVSFGNVALDWAEQHPKVDARFEKPAAMFQAIRAAGCTRVAFAGGMKRPRLNPLKFDKTFLKLAPKLLPALRSGDDKTLRTIAEIFEDEGLTIVAAHDILSDLLITAGVPTITKPSKKDKADALRAKEIVAALGVADVGQGAVVAQGICLGLETIQGTDALLSFVAETADDFRTDPKGGRGVFYKAPKPGQDWRADLPAIGPDTIRAVHAAGLAGIVVAAGGVMVLRKSVTIEIADDLGLFIWAEDGTA